MDNSKVNTILISVGLVSIAGLVAYGIYKKNELSQGQMLTIPNPFYNSNGNTAPVNTGGTAPNWWSYIIGQGLQSGSQFNWGQFWGY